MCSIIVQDEGTIAIRGSSFTSASVPAHELPDTWVSMVRDTRKAETLKDTPLREGAGGRIKRGLRGMGKASEGCRTRYLRIQIKGPADAKRKEDQTPREHRFSSYLYGIFTATLDREIYLVPPLFAVSRSRWNACRIDKRCGSMNALVERTRLFESLHDASRDDASNAHSLPLLASRLINFELNEVTQVPKSF